MPRANESLRRQWANQRAQSIEERTHDQSGRPRPPEGIWEEDFNVAVMDALLALPLGTKFEGPEVSERVRATFGAHPTPAPASSDTSGVPDAVHPDTGSPTTPNNPATVGVWAHGHPPMDTADGAAHREAFARVVAANEEYTKREVLWRYYEARQGDLRAFSDALGYATELETALRDVLDALSGGTCPSHDATEEGCAACEAIVLLDGGFTASLTRR